jgi:hypothetical protein
MMLLLLLLLLLHVSLLRNERAGEGLVLGSRLGDGHSEVTPCSCLACNTSHKTLSFMRLQKSENVLPPVMLLKFEGEKITQPNSCFTYLQFYKSCVIGAI